MMRMLHAGGIPAYADNLVSFESNKILGLPADTSWLSEAEGHAVKIPEPLFYQPPLGFDWRFVLMHRDYREQAKSQVKFMRLVARQSLPKSAIKALAESLEEDYPKMRAFLWKRGQVLEVSFEKVIAGKVPATELDVLTGLHLDWPAMRAQIVPRSPKCLPGLLELSMMEAMR